MACMLRKAQQRRALSQLLAVWLRMIVDQKKTRVKATARLTEAANGMQVSVIHL